MKRPAEDVTVLTNKKPRIGDGNIYDWPECDICLKQFKKPSALRIHYAIHAGDKNYQCEICSHAFTDKSNLIAHVKTVHEKITRFKCDECSKKYFYQSCLNKHKIKHDLRYAYKCDKCGKRMKYESSFNKHSCEKRNTHHNCNVCSKIFDSKKKLTRHLKTHTLTSDYKCEYEQCTKSYKSQDALKIHMFSHTGERPFCCNICEKSFKTKHILQIHIQTHNKPKIKCEQCNKYIGLKQHKCDLQKCGGCKQIFASSQELLIHTSENRKFKCNKCGYCFKRKDHLNNHIITHDSKTKFECDICHELFTTSQSVSRHKLRKHK